MKLIFPDALSQSTIDAVLDAHEATRKALSRRGWCMTPQIDREHYVEVSMRFEHLNGAVIWMRFNPRNKRSEMIVAVDGVNEYARAEFWSWHGFNTLNPDDVVRAIKIAKRLKTKDKSGYGVRWQSTKTVGEYRQGYKTVKVTG